MISKKVIKNIQNNLKYSIHEMHSKTYKFNGLMMIKILTSQREIYKMINK